MPLPVIAGVFRCAITWTAIPNGQSAVNVLHVSSDTLDAGDIIDSLNTNAADHSFDLINSGSADTSINVTPLDGTSPSVAGSLPNWNGGDSGEDAWPQMAAVLRLYTDTRGPSFRGKMFQPFLTESNVTDGLIKQDTIDDVLTAWGAMQDLLEADDCRFVVASYLHASALPVIDFRMSQRPGRIKRRLS